MQTHHSAARAVTTTARLCAMLIVVVSINACGSKSPTTPSSNTGSNNTPTPSGSTSLMTATISGVPWSALSTSIVATRLNLGPALTDQYINISGGDAAAVAIGFAVQATGPGTFIITQPSANNPNTGNNNANLGVGVQRWEASSAIPGSSGTITITSLSATAVSGTFALTLLPSPSIAFGAAGTKTVTNGSFSAKF